MVYLLPLAPIAPALAPQGSAGADTVDTFNAWNKAKGKLETQSMAHVSDVARPGRLSRDARHLGLQALWARLQKRWAGV